MFLCLFEHVPFAWCFFFSFLFRKHQILAAVRCCLFYLRYKDRIGAEKKKKMGWFSLFAFFLSLPSLLWLVNLSLGIIFWIVPTLCLFNALQNTPALLVSLAAVFWMSRSRCLGGTLRDIQKTGARETMLLCIIPSSLISWACQIVWPSMCTTFLTSCLALDITSTWFSMDYYAGYQRFFSRAAGIFGVGRRPTHLRVTIKTWQKPETALEKSLAPRVM